MRSFFGPLLIGLALSACTPSYQTSSGAAYVAKQPARIDADIARIARIEPDLQFPAKIGVARVINGRLTAIPGAEAALFGDFGAQNPHLGRIEALSPLVHQMVQGEATTKGTLHAIRMAAARQHMDYIIVYEIGARSRTANTPFALADVTLIGGALLPTRSIKVAGVGSAAFVDVRNGYPYSNVTTTTDLSGLGRSFNSGRAAARLRDKAIQRTAEALMPQVQEMLQELYKRQ